MIKILALLLLTTALTAAPLERDLGEGLAYARVHTLPADLPAAPAKPGPLVLDLRYAAADADAASALAAWLGFRATAAAPVLLLVNSATAPAVLHVLAARAPAAGVVTLGAAAEDFRPDIALNVDPTEARPAYDALEHGATIESLLAENSTKPRTDEAALAAERKNAPPPPDPALDEPVATAPGKSPAPPTSPHDPALQRAVHLHRALRALKRI